MTTRQLGSAHSAPPMVRLLRTPIRHVLPRSVLLLRYVSAAGATIILPIQAAQDDKLLVVLAGHAEDKRWWRHFRDAAPAQVCLDGEWHEVIGHVAAADSEAASLYRRRFPRAPVRDSATFVEFRGGPGMPASLRGRSLFMRWLTTVTAGEFTGFAVPAVTGALTARASVTTGIVAILIAGAVEGTVLGLSQAAVLRHALPSLPARRWVAATAIGAVLAYVMGMLPSSTADRWTDWPPAVLALAGSVVGVALLASIGTAQWLVLRTALPRSASWIATTALAWLIGLGVFLGFATPLWQPGQPLALIVAIGAGGGLLMAAATSAITGLALWRRLP
ncbi:hypothetical protein ACGFJ7_13845 [Actinoplanes sp. NPDC048988]|uniref:hypothetical protein n=1 Tax=Actinoplanes sp. NPDC048988 TaxID=3363901 RepID=UPI0037215022